MENYTLYGIENGFNWGIDWFLTKESAEKARKDNPRAYGHDTFIFEMTEDEIKEKNL